MGEFVLKAYGKHPLMGLHVIFNLLANDFLVKENQIFCLIPSSYLLVLGFSMYIVGMPKYEKNWQKSEMGWGKRSQVGQGKSYDIFTYKLQSK